MLIYRELSLSEAERIREIDATQYIENVWRQNETTGQFEVLRIDWTEDELPNGMEWHLARFAETCVKGGSAFGCFDGDTLVGYATVNAQQFGITEHYVLLDQLFVSKAYRGQGIGRQLVELCRKQAKKNGAEKLYICAGSAIDTLKFYQKLGCQLANEIDKELSEEDPRDIQLELVVS